ncbi:hypothetical protein PC9H_001888 [Pleurotus ostreatus]|uniref:Uncharacterized protein n=1 Tax=Pleurotus ostreatus TaxID=5322 RepID=A0A8H7DPX7_PLEOS|nr:uncharacterized protein PC9H_001888 [Pleurotus ostreatus]KAF7419301.1 hypothetical protein PC9H_001888 [Pleurotus ostreatus]KAJ8689929.1 hypothetical protein PTI98_012784 [Pleurotus ostreatus]
MDALSFPSIPEDIERCIIEAVALDYVKTAGPAEVLKLVYICRAYRAWVYPILYRSIYVEDTDEYDACLAKLRNSLTQSPHLAGLVRHLTFPNLTSISEYVMAIVPLCNNLVSLAYWASGGSSTPCTELPGSSTLDLSKCTSLRRLGIVFSRVVEIPPKVIDPNVLPQLIRRLTHLDLVGGNNVPWYPLLRYFTSLSHLFLGVENFDPQLEQIQLLLPAMPPALIVCILFKFGPSVDVSHTGTVCLATGDVDPRIVIGFDSKAQKLAVPFINRTLLQFANRRELLADWAILDDRLDFWAEAEAIIHARRRKAHMKAS